MKKNKKKNIYGVVGGFFLSIFIIFPFFVTLKAEAVTTFYEYINVGGVQSRICGIKYEAMCNIALQQIPGCEKFSCSKTSQLDNYICVSAIPPICPKDEVQTVDPQKDTPKSDVYTFLAPLTEEKTAPNNIGDYFNWIFTLAIGLCGALAVIMIVIGGVTYMGSESIFGKTEAKKQITNAILGLLIALGAFALLNTINPDLLKTDINIKQVSAEIVNFDVSGSATFDGKPIKINFNKEAYPAAKIASEKTGVETAFILAMFAQETGSGSNTGGCNYSSANMGSGQLDSLKTVATSLGLDYTKINMSCSGGGSSHGGAIGYTQFLPGTWLLYRAEAKQLLGHEPNPWNTADALMMTALFLKSNGGAGSNPASQETAACKYFGSCSVIVSCGGGKTGTYGQCIMGKKLSIQQQIDEAIKKGEIN